MICALSGKPPRYCVPDIGMYQRGCRCDGARRANTEYQREYHRRAICPLCLSYTSRPSGFCEKCEGEL